MALAAACVDELRLGPLLFRHQGRAGPVLGEICGHHHPKAHIPTRGTVVTRPCFVFDSRRLMLPAIGAYTGGLDVRDPAIAALFPRGGRVFLLGRDRLFSFNLAGRSALSLRAARVHPLSRPPPVEPESRLIQGDPDAAMSRATEDAPVLLWLRRDLRLRDNPALSAAIATGRPIIPVFVLDEATPGAWAPGGAALWWLHHSLEALAADFAALGARLILRRGSFEQEIAALVAETGAAEIHAGTPVEPWARRAVAALQERLDVKLHLHLTTLLYEPGAIRTQAGGGYGVYTPFARACHARGLPPPPQPAPRHLRAGKPVRSDALSDWGLLPTRPDWAGGLRAAWTPGERGAGRRLAEFVNSSLPDYARQRDQPGIDGTSRLSPHLAFGEISPAEIWHAAERVGAPAWPSSSTSCCGANSPRICCGTIRPRRKRRFALNSPA